jgi:putative FmdB family regulatory protein
VPLYEFYCPRCKKGFEELCRDSTEQLPCPQCATESKKVLSTFCGGRRGGGGGSSGSCSGCSGKNCSTC